jgi:multiple antibiotic resistance protein
MKSIITSLVQRSLARVKLSFAYLVIAVLSLLFLLGLTPPSLIEETAIALTPPSPPAKVQAVNPTPANRYAAAKPPAEKFESMLDTQASLIPKIREFYGGEGSYRGAFAIFFLTVGPLKIIPAFIKLTVNADEALRKQLALRGFIIATLSVLFAAIFGQNLLIKYNIPLTAIIAAGGILLFLVALRIVLSQYGDDDHSPDPPPEKPSLALVVQPLVFPTILTPYGIAVVITLSALARELDGNLMKLLGTLIAIMVLNLLAMLFARQILHVLKPKLLQVIGLVLGVIQLSLGLGLIFSAIELQALVIKRLLSL